MNYARDIINGCAILYGNKSTRKRMKEKDKSVMKCQPAVALKEQDQTLFQLSFVPV